MEPNTVLPEIVVRPNEPVGPDTSVTQGTLPVDTTPQPEEQPTLPVDTSINQRYVVPSTSTAEDRSLKAAIGVGPVIGQTRDQIYSALMAGNEPAVRAQAAAAIDEAYYKARQQRIMAMAAQNAGPLTPAQIDTMMAKTLPIDPETVLEHQYSQKIFTTLDTARQYLPGTFMDEAKEQIPEHVDQVIDATSTLWAKREFASSKLQDMQDELEKQGMGGWLVDQAKGLLPGYNEVKMRGLAPSTGYTDGVFLGNNIAAQVKELLDLPLDQFKVRLTAILEHLKKDNPTLAVQYAAAVMGTSTQDRIVNNLFTAMDVGTIAGTGLGIAKHFALKQEVNAAAKSVITAMQAGKDVSTALEAAGAVSEAAVKKAVTSIASGDEIKKSLDQPVSGLTLDLERIRDNPGKLSREQHTRLVNDYENAITGLQDTVANTARVQRVSLQEATEEGLRRWKDNAMTDYPSLSNKINDIVDVHYNPITNLWGYTMDLRNTGLELFKSQQQAYRFVEENGLRGARIQRQGLGFRVLVDKPLRETDNILRDLLAVTGKVEVPNSWANAVFGRFRTPEDTMSIQENTLRQVATYASSNYHKYIREQTQFMSDVAKGIIRVDPLTGEKLNPIAARVRSFFHPINTRQQHQQFKRTLEMAADMKNPDTGKPGYYFRTPQELVDHYQRNFERDPTFHEIQGYFGASRAYESDRMFRALLSTRNKGRLGVEEHQFYRTLEDGSREASPKFEGIAHNNIPGSEDKVFDVSKGDTFIAGHQSNRVNEARAAVKAGTKQFVEIFDTDQFPLAKYVGSERVRYVLADKFSSSPLDISKQINRQSGGHFDYKTPLYIKMPIMLYESLGKTKEGVEKHRWIYLGDKTVHAVDNHVMAADVLSRYRKVMDLMRAKDLKGAEAEWKSFFGHEDWETFQSWFKSGRDENGNPVKAHLDLQHDMYVVPRDKNIISHLGKAALENKYIVNEATKKTSFVDGTRSGNRASQFQVRYSQERADQPLLGLQNKGTVANPLYGYKRAELADPMVTMNNSLNRVINSLFMEDYKIYAVENWLRQAENYLKAPLDEVRAAPFAHFNAELPELHPNTPPVIRDSLMNNWYKIRQFTGIPNKFDTYVNHFTQKMVDQFYQSFGPEEQRGIAAKAATVVPLWAISRVKDPVTALRSLAFNAKLGLFAFPQVFVQLQTMTSIAAIAPKSVIQGTIGSLLHQYSRLTAQSPKMMASLDRIASKMGYRPGEWLESRKLANQTGFFHVAGEYAGLDDALQNKFIRNNFGDFLHFGQVFFKGSERQVRMAAWYTAYHEFRKEFPTGLINQTQRDSILHRADLLYTNMSRASASALHSGALSLTTQFLSYQLRLAELFLGKRLGATTGERMLARTRLMAAYGMMYGIPSALGLTGIPAGDWIKAQEQEKYGYNAGEKWWSTLLNEGVPAYLIGLSTGTLPDFGSRYGSGGFTALRSDRTWWEMLGGAGVSTASGMWKDFAGLRNATFEGAVSTMLGGHPQSQVFPMKIQDWVDGLSEISSVNQTKKTLYALNYGKWITKNEGYVQDIGKGTAIMYGLTGLQPQSVDDLYNMSLTRKDELEYQKEAEKQFTKEWHRAIQAGLDNDPTSHREYVTRAFAYLDKADYPIEKRAALVARASKGYESQIEAFRQIYGISKDVPQNLKEVRRQSYIDWLNKKQIPK